MSVITLLDPELVNPSKKILPDNMEILVSPSKKILL